MTDREKLIELQLRADLEDEVSENTTEHRGYTADLMLANGIIVLPCKAGDVLYVPTAYWDGRIYDLEISNIIIYEDKIELVTNCGSRCTVDDIGKTAFLTREEAETALRERGGENA